MKRLLLGLILAAAPAWCTVLPSSTTLLYYPIQFNTAVTAVTSVDTPEWARLTDVFAWWELKLGSFDNGGSPITIYLRGLLKQSPPGFTVVQWLELIPVSFVLGDDPGNPASNSPEAGTLGLVAGGLAAAALAKGRRRNPQ
ncbi:MAG: hypothetical protein HY820_24275 [Acidobacteria bacterium]|nr:hypothetical protein [Acidobacteriota bacterium]